MMIAIDFNVRRLTKFLGNMSISGLSQCFRSHAINGLHAASHGDVCPQFYCWNIAIRHDFKRFREIVYRSFEYQFGLQ